MARLLACAFVGLAAAQKAGKQTKEFHLPLPTQECTKSGGCSTKQTKVVIDGNWRWLHHTGDTNNCYTGNEWNKTYCDTWEDCTKNCALDGVDQKTYNGTYGIRVSGNALNLSYVTQGPYSKNVGSRTFLMDTDDTYQIFKLKNKEFTFDVDSSDLPCGLNGALYFVEMDADGGKAKFPTNEAGAALGTGYCDAQCPHDMKWINGEANLIGWNASSKSKDRGTGKYGTCCAELDVWEANKISTQMTVHGCSTKGPYRCDGIECGDDKAGQRFNGTCDKDGCDFNPYRVGATNYYGEGPSHTLDSTKKMTVVTQFITNDGTDTGDLVEMRRVYYQDGKKIANPMASYGHFDSITDKQCTTQKTLFGDFDDFTPKGGIKAMGEAMGRGMVLVMSVWDDDEVHMIWLDAVDPIPKSGQQPKKGAPRGTCSAANYPNDPGNPDTLRKAHPHSSVVYANIRFGDINTTVGPPGPPTPPGPPGPPTPPTPSGCPGGSLSACINLCPSNPPAAYQACVQNCVKRCTPPSSPPPPKEVTQATAANAAAASALAAARDESRRHHPLHEGVQAAGAAGGGATPPPSSRRHIGGGEKDLDELLKHAPLEAQLKVARAQEELARAKEAAAEALVAELEAEVEARDAALEIDAQDA